MSGGLFISQTGLQALNTALETVSDNLANSNTTGFQSESANFETLLGSLVGDNAIGGGADVTGINRDFSQGAIVQASSATDLAIQGNGFFVLTDPAGNTYYSRNGNFTVGADGNLTGPDGTQVQGFALNPSGTASGVLAPITIPQGPLAPTASTKIAVDGNVNSASPVVTGAIDPTNPATYSASVSSQVFDSLGQSHTVTFFLQNAGPSTATPPTEQWNWLATFDGSTTGLGGNTGSLQFDNSGAVTTGGAGGPLTVTPTGASPLSLNLDFSMLTQFAGGNTPTATADGNAVGSPLGVQIDNSGVISVSYSNGQTQKVAEVALATFPSEQGLSLTTGGFYQQTGNSGTPTVSSAQSGSAGSIQSGALESSNVDTTTQLVNLVAFEKSFQANAKGLQTADNVLTTLNQLQI